MASPGSGKTALLRFALFAFASTLVYSAGAFTPTADQKICATLPANAEVVAACNRIIEAPSSSALDRAASYTFRADAARADGNTTAAIADYSQATSIKRSRCSPIMRNCIIRAASPTE
jgi:hypothetical protein